MNLRSEYVTSVPLKRRLEAAERAAERGDLESAAKFMELAEQEMILQLATAFAQVLSPTTVPAPTFEGHRS